MTFRPHGPGWSSARHEAERCGKRLTTPLCSNQARSPWRRRHSDDIGCRAKPRLGQPASQNKRRFRVHVLPPSSCIRRKGRKGRNPRERLAETPIVERHVTQQEPPLRETPTRGSMTRVPRVGGRGGGALLASPHVVLQLHSDSLAQRAERHVADRRRRRRVHDRQATGLAKAAGTGPMLVSD